MKKRKIHNTKINILSKKGMPDMRKEDEKDPHRGITRTPSQHDSLAPEDEALEEDDFQDEIELEDED